MQFESISAFLNMGGYAAYVWPSWCLAVAMLVGFVLVSRWERRRVLADIKRRRRREASTS